MTTDEKQAIKEFCSQYAWLRWVYDDYLALYEKGPERIQLLHEVAPHFFERLNRILVQHIELGICKLTDPPGRKGQKNLTIKYILELIGEKESKKLGLDVLAKSILVIRPYIIKGRNKAIAHLDRDALVSKSIFNQYPREVLDRFWESLREFVDKVRKHYFGSIIGEVIDNKGAIGLVGALKKGVHWKDYFSDHTDLCASAVREMRYKNA
ncbi:MAG: hypothetical protein ISS79_07400 [Phycisphaerae bacterium]|nr:hypothetical protein [Phycisphaerae bacterium]